MSRGRGRWTNTRYGPSSSPAPPAVAATPALASTSPAVTIVASGTNVVQDVEVTSTGGSISAFGVGTITLSSGSGWCTAQHRIDPTSGKRYLRYTINPSTLTPGSYTATIPVTFGNSSPSSINCVVTVTCVASLNGVLRAAARNLNGGTVSAGQSPSPTTILLRNVGSNLQLAGPVVGSIVYYSGSGWLTATATNNGDGTYNLTVTPATGALGAGNYRASFAVSDPACTNSIEVHYNVTVATSAVPTLTATPGALLFSAVEGGSDPVPQTITLTNSGGGTLAGPTVSESPSAAWVTPTITGSGNNWTCTVAPVTGSLTPNTYSTTLEFADTADTTSAAASRRVNVSFVVQATQLPPRTQTGTLERLNVGSGNVRGWCGVPLPPGWLLPANITQFRLLDASNNEIPIYAEALTGLHADGSLKSVYVEFQQQLTNGTPVPITMQCGVARNTAQDLTRQIPNDYWVLGGPVADRNNNTAIWKAQYPDAIVNFPATYLSTTQWWGPYDLRYKGEAGGPSWQASYFQRWELANDTWWNSWNTFSTSGGVTSIVNQYDYPCGTFMLWAATGNAEYYKRACTQLVEHRNRYLRFYTPASPGSGIAVREMIPWGLCFHYFLTGDASSKTNLGNMAATQSQPSGVFASLDNYLSEPRELAFIGESLCAAKACGATNLNWDTRMDAWLVKWLPAATAHPGWITSGTWTGLYWNRIMYQGLGMPQANNDPVTQNFMLALLCQFMEELHTFFPGSAYLSEATTRTAGILNGLLATETGTNGGGYTVHHYNNASPAFVTYNSTFGQAGHSTRDTVDNNGLYLAAFGAAGARQNNTTWINHATALGVAITGPLTGTAGGPYILNNMRTNNEWWKRSWEGLSKMYP